MVVVIKAFTQSERECPADRRFIKMGLRSPTCIVQSHLYDKIKADVRIRREIAERVGIRFEWSSIAPSAPTLSRTLAKKSWCSYFIEGERSGCGGRI